MDTEVTPSVRDGMVYTNDQILASWLAFSYSDITVHILSGVLLTILITGVTLEVLTGAVETGGISSGLLGCKQA
jgi:hypothetical protein